MVLAFKGSGSSYHPIESYAGGPHINLFIVSTSCEDLGSKVEGGADDGQHFYLLRAEYCFLADAEVDEFEFLRGGVEEDIFGFDVSVADVVLVYVGDCGEELGEDCLEYFFILE